MKKILSAACAAFALLVACNRVETASIILDKDVINVESSGDRTTLGVKSNRAWVASVDKDWVTLTPSSAEAFEANSYMIVDVQANNDEERTATITVSAKSGELSVTLELIQGEDAFVIKTAEQFVSFMEKAAAGEVSENYKISRDIDLSGKVLPEVSELAVVLDGQGSTIKNWISSAPLFNTVSRSGAVRNIVLDSSCMLSFPEVYGNFGFITCNNEGQLSGIVNNADVQMTSLAASPSGEVTNAFVGVICGDCSGRISDCHNRGDISYAGPPASINVYYGGVVGRVTGEDASAENLSNSGDMGIVINGVAGTSLYFSGVAGSLNANAKLLNSSNEGDVLVRAYGNTAMMATCGIVAYAGGELSDCTNKGDISYFAESSDGLADGAVQRTGVCGIAAYMGWGGNTVRNNHNEGNVSFRAGYPLKYAQCGSATKYSTNVAGVFGHMYKCAVDNCSNSGKVRSVISDIDNANSYFGTDIRQSCAGIVASSWGDISNCTNSGDIEVIWTVSPPKDGVERNGITQQFIAQVGGISGGDYHSDQTSTGISACSNSGNIRYVCDANASNNSLGGIAGWPMKENVAGKAISNCENSGTIVIEGYSKTRAGCINGGCITVKNCINRGEIHLKSGQSTCTIGGISGVASGLQPLTGCVNSGKVTSDVLLAGAQGGSASGIGGLVGASYNQATVTITDCESSCGITAPEGSTAYMLVAVVGSNKAVKTANLIGSVESPNVISGGYVQLGTVKTEATSDNFLTLALPWGTGSPTNANIVSNTIWR